MDTRLDEQLGVRLQDEHKALLRLSQVLREHIAALPGMNRAQWLVGLRVAFDRLHAHVERCITMKEKDGYLEQILREKPTLARQVETVKAEHGQVLRLAVDLRDQLAAVKPEDHLLVEDGCSRVERFIEIVSQHEQRENMIVLFAFNQDIGAF
jgi:hemerythrin-like domain-containing protein